MGRRSISVGVAGAICLVAVVVHLGTAPQPAGAAAVPFGVGAAFQSVAFGDATRGWAVGSAYSGGGVIASTTDGGVSWTPRSFPMSTVTQFNGVASVGPVTAWAVGSSPGGTGSAGVVMATTDGVNWSQQTIPSVSNLTGVSFVSNGVTPASGWAVGFVGIPVRPAILATINGGTTWTSQTAPAGVDMLSSVSFTDLTHGWAAGSVISGTTSQSVVISTSDGGATWAKQTVPVSTNLNAITFRDLTHGWAAGMSTTGGHLIATSDGGVTWAAQTLPAGSPSIRGVAFGSLTAGWAVGTNVGGGPGVVPGAYIFATSNGGTTWTRQAARPTNKTVYGVAAMSPTKAWAVGGGSCLGPSILATSNGGDLWTEQLNAVPVLTTLAAVTSVDATHAWAVGSDSCQSGAIVRTVDGFTWTAAAVPAGVGDLMAVSFVDQNRGWAVGYNQGGGPYAAAIAIATTDGGATWSISQIPAGIGALYGVRFVSATKGWAVGTAVNQGVIITTSDGGLTWTAQSLPAGINSVGGVWFVDATHGWATGASANVGRMLVTSDGGTTWTLQTLPANSLPYRITFTDLTNGWAGSTDSSLFSGGGQVVRTTDGGSTWTATAIPSADYIQAVSFASTTNGWAAGSVRGTGLGGVIAGSTTGGASWVPQTVPSGVTQLNSVAAASTTNAWAVGYASGQGLFGVDAAVILGTINAGATWSAQSYTYPGMPRQAVVPALANAAYGGYTTATYIKNLGAAPASVQVKYFDAAGASVGIGDASTIQPNAMWIVRQDNGNGLATGQAGSGLVLGSQPLAVFVNEFAPGGADGTSYTGISSGVGSTLFAPTIGNGAYGGYTTGIGLVNTGSSATNLTVSYRDTNGTAVKTQTLNNVAAGAYQGIYSGDAVLALPTGFAGTATITSSAGSIAAIVNETGPGGQFSSYDAVPLGSTTLYAPVALNNAYGGYYTGMGIQNTTGTAGTVTINYYDATGTATTKAFAIAPYGYIGVYQGSVTDGPPPGAYTAKVTSTVAIAATVIEVAPSTITAPKQSTAYNTFTTGSSTLHLPLVESAGVDGWSTGEGIMNTGTAATAVTVTYYDIATGATIGTPQSLTLQANAFWGLYQPTGGLPAGMRATAIVRTAAGGQVAVICNESNATTFMSYIGQ